jgi:hypothetical protein
MYEGQIIGGIFAKRHDADGAIEALQELEISSDDIEEFVQLDKTHSKEAHIEILSERGFAEAQAIYYDKLIREGNILLVVYNVTDPSPIIDVFDEYEARYNPNGSRNLRDDVLGTTAGTIVGAVGAAAGAVVGGGSGAVAGKAIEHRK